MYKNQFLFRKLWTLCETGRYVKHSFHFLRSELRICILVTTVSLKWKTALPDWSIHLASYYDFNFKVLYDIFSDQNEVLTVTRRVQNTHSFKTTSRVLCVRIQIFCFPVPVTDNTSTAQLHSDIHPHTQTHLLTITIHTPTLQCTHSQTLIPIPTPQLPPRLLLKLTRTLLRSLMMSYTAVA